MALNATTVLVVDPRLPRATGGATLARRRQSFAGDVVLLFDNGKLLPDYGPYVAIFDVLESHLEHALAGARIERAGDDLLVGTADRLATVAAEIGARKPAGVVFALCDWGVSQPTTLVAAALERFGIPAVVIATDIGVRQAYATASRLVPGLPLVSIAALRSASYKTVAAEMENATGLVVEGLTAAPERLMARFAEHAMPAAPAASASGTLELPLDGTDAVFTDLMARDGLGDGLPLVAPTAERVEAFLAAASWDPEEEVWPQIPPRERGVSVRDVAAVAAMAGCEPRWAPIVLAAYQAAGDPEFKLFQAAITVHPSGTLVLVSGPLADELGVACGRGCLGPGFPANARIGRAIALSYSFLLGAQPGATDLTAQGSPAEYSYCCAENLAESPWPGLHADLGHPEETTVTVIKAEGPHNIVDQQSTVPERLLETFASSIATLGANSSYAPIAQMVVFMNPEHAALLAEAGWTKPDVANFLFDTARNRREDLRGRGVAPTWPRWFDSLDRVPVVTRPEEFLIAVVGGAGTASQVAIPWGFARGVTRAVRL